MPVTVNVLTHEVFGAIVAPDNVIKFDTTDSVPPQFETELSGVVIPAGSVSVKDTPVNAVERFAFPIVIVKTEVCPKGTEVGVKAIETAGGSNTVMTNVCESEVSSPLLTVPPLSLKVTVTVAVPIIFRAGVNVRLPFVVFIEG